MTRLAPFMLALSLGLSIGLSIVCAPLHASADEGAARALFLEGQGMYRRGDYEAAIAYWQRAYEVDPRPLLQFNLAQAYGRMGKLVEEQRALQLFLETTGAEDPGIESAASRLTIVERALARTAIVVKAEGAEGASIFINGQDRGLLPRPDPFKVDPGAHRVEIRLEGYEPFEAHLIVPAGEETALRVELSPIRGSDETPTAGRRSLALPIAFYSSGGALLLTGAVLGGLSLSASADAPPRGSEEANRSRALAIGADITIAAGAALAVTGLILHLVRPKGAAEKTIGRALRPSLSPHLLGLTASGEF